MYVGSFQNVVLETPAVAGTSTGAVLNIFPGVFISVSP